MTVYNIERGERQLRLSEAVEVLDCLGKTADCLIKLIAPEVEHQNATDRLIGQNVENLRKGISSDEIAMQMQDRGYAWTNRTVGEIERGERPLGLSEAVDLLPILGQHDGWALNGLLSENMNSAVIRECKSIKDLAKRILELWGKLDSKRSILAGRVKGMSEVGQHVDKQTLHDLIFTLMYSEQEYLFRRHMWNRLVENEQLEVAGIVPEPEQIDVETFRSAIHMDSDNQHDNSIEDQIMRNLDNTKKLEDLLEKL